MLLNHIYDGINVFLLIHMILACYESTGNFPLCINEDCVGSHKRFCF